MHCYQSAPCCVILAGVSFLEIWFAKMSDWAAVIMQGADAENIVCRRLQTPVAFFCVVLHKNLGEAAREMSSNRLSARVGRSNELFP